MVEAIINIILKQLVSAAVDWLKEEISLLKNVKPKLLNMENKMKIIQTALEEAENESVKREIVKLWLEKLKEVCYDMDDMLDEWSTRVHMRQREKEEAAKFICFSMEKLNCLSSGKQLPRRCDIALKINDIDGRIELVFSEMEKLLLVSEAVGNGPINKISNDSARKTTSLVDDTKVHDRDDEKDFLLRKVLSMNTEQENSPQVISIVGSGGLGKTTLAQMVYNDGQVKEKFGKNRIWVCVSNPFDEVKVAKDILEGLKVDHDNMTSLQTLHQSIEEKLSGVSFLLVLDDVWNETPDKWEKLRLCLRLSNPDSRILVTTRKREVASIMGTTASNIFTPQLISDLGCWVLMSQIVFQGRSDKCNDDLEAIGKKIAKKCKGLPLAAKTLGGMLRSKVSVAKWTAILDSEIWKLEKAQVELFPHMFLSYQDLPAMLKHCFLILAIFPKDTKLRVEEVVRIWMAHGLLDPMTKKDDMVNTCEENLQILVGRALLEETADNGILMHDIIHDFALHLLGGEVISTIVLDKSASGSMTTSKMARHLYVDGNNIDPTATSLDVEKLRTCIIRNVATYITLDLVKGLKMVRALYLSNSGLKAVPKSIEKLIHLRLLDLSHNPLVKLPVTIGGLCNLQELILEVTPISTLPDSIGKLTNLIFLRSDSRLKKYPESVGKLINLQYLGRYLIVEAGKSKLGFLKDLNQLRGELEILFCGEYGDEVDVKKAALENKKHITKLILDFIHEDVTDGVIAALQPPSHIQDFNLHRLPHSWGLLPSWITSLHHLKDLSIVGAPNLSTLPPLGELQSLQTLSLRGLDALKVIGSEFLGNNNNEVFVAFPSLLELEIFYCELLEEWSDIKAEDEGKVTFMPRLQRVYINRCKKFKVLPSRLLCGAASLELLSCKGNNSSLREYIRNEKQLLERVKNVYINDQQCSLHLSADHHTHSL